MMRSIKKLLLVVLSSIIFWGCPTTPPKPEKETIKKPAITIKVASLNLTNLNKRIERKNISEFVKKLKSEQIEVLAVQGISRYPGVTTRIDFVNELTTLTDWRNVFGEMLNISGRQTGNAVFSSYPILSHYNQIFEKVSSDNYESALQANIDIGINSITVVSALLPPKATPVEQTQCVKTIYSIIPNENNSIVIIAGNLPPVESIRDKNIFSEVPSIENGKKKNSKMWYSGNNLFRLIESNIIETDLGIMIVAEMGIFK